MDLPPRRLHTPHIGAIDLCTSLRSNHSQRRYLNRDFFIHLWHQSTLRPDPDLDADSDLKTLSQRETNSQVAHNRTITFLDKRKKYQTKTTYVYLQLLSQLNSFKFGKKPNFSPPFHTNFWALSTQTLLKFKMGFKNIAYEKPHYDLGNNGYLPENIDHY